VSHFTRRIHLHTIPNALPTAFSGRLLESSEIMALAPGTRLGPYEIQALLGAGGMGEVYRARDCRLERSVALKVLAPRPLTSGDDKERFQREARAISSLSHPHICALYDVGRADGTDYLVMEYLEGETLAQRLKRGPLPLPTLVDLATQIADALDQAHRQRLVHRDLKPGNIMLTKSGAKLLDFGLAKTLAPATLLSSDATATRGLTETGRVVGTYPYMSPEQLQGKEADVRSDIFALGAVLYEMATGERAFPNDSQLAVAAAVLEKDPPGLASLRPPLLERVVRSCLEKDPERRWQSARDLKRALEWVRDSPGAAAAKPSRRRSALPWLVATLATLVALASLAGHALRPQAAPGARPIQRSSLLPPAGYVFAPGDFSISPDGSRLAFVAIGSDGRRSLWVRSLDARTAQELKDPGNPERPFWGPDGRRIGYFAEGKLKAVDVGSGAVQVLADAPEARGGSWGRDGTVVFSPNRGPILAVAGHGGAPRQVTPFDAAAEKTLGRLSFLPDGARFLYARSGRGLASSPRTGTFAGSIDGSEPVLVLPDVTSRVRYASGHLLYMQQGSLVARRFDAARLAFTGPAVTLRGVPVERFRLAESFTVAENGVMVYEAADDVASELLWYDRGGKLLGRLSDAGLWDPQLSPDGRLLAVSEDGRNGRTFIRIIDLQRGISTQITDGGQEMYPTWSTDGMRVAYQAGTASGLALAEIPADGSGEPRVLLEGGAILPSQYSPDGRQLVYMRYDSLVDSVALLDLEKRTSRDLVAGAEGQLSPDGKWLAYNSVPREGRDLHVFVQPFPGPGPQVQISREGGAQPRWSRDGRRVYYVAPDRKLMEVEVDVLGGRLTAQAPRPLFQTRIVAPTYVLYQYDVTRDGSRFLVNSLKADAPLTLLSDWTGALGQ
jgi:serine/threonine protein kinase